MINSSHQVNSIHSFVLGVVNYIFAPQKKESNHAYCYPKKGCFGTPKGRLLGERKTSEAERRESEPRAKAKYTYFELFLTTKKHPLGRIKKQTI